MSESTSSLRFTSLLRRSLLALAALYAVALVAVVAGRIAWPFEIEWMEGGMLTHAVRLRLGQAIYTAPSADFVPFFYTPGYPALLAGLSLLGLPLGFALGRAVSALATLATLALVYSITAREAGRGWGLFAACLYAAFFRFCGAFYDVVRPDALALALSLASAAVAYRARTATVAATAGLLLAAAFLTKQTTAVFGPAIGVALLVRDRRQGLAFVATAAGAGALGAWILERATGGWFWFYIFEGHQGHAFLWKNVLLEYWRDVLFLAPALVLVPALALARGRWTRWLALLFVGLLAAAFVQRATSLNYPEHMYYRELWYEPRRVLVLVPPLLMAALLFVTWLVAEPRSAHRLPPYWLGMAAAGAIASALNHSTQWAYANCFMPIAVFGTVAVALTIAEAVEGGGAGAVMMFAATLVQLVALGYDPRAQVPSREDRRALDAFLRRVAESPGPVLIPSHPFTAYQASGKVHLHQMSIGDVAFNGGVADLSSRIARGEWPTVIVDQNTTVPDLDRTMYVSDRFAYDGDALYSRTGFRVRPLTLWRAQSVVNRDLAPGLTANFEGGDYAGWVDAGGAFGGRPASRAELRAIGGVEGRRAASSRGTAGGGSLVSAVFVAERPRITLLVAGSLGTYVRAMHGDDEIARAQPVDARTMAPRFLDVQRWVGQPIHLEIVDAERTEVAGAEHPGIVVDDIRESW
jgi:hypothetical protein